MRFQSLDKQPVGRPPGRGSNGLRPPVRQAYDRAPVVAGEERLLGDVTRKRHRRRDDPDPGDRPAASALRHRAAKCVVADRGMISAEAVTEARGAAALVHPGRARALRQAGSRTGADRSAQPFVPLTTRKRGKEIDYVSMAPAIFLKSGAP